MHNRSLLRRKHIPLGQTVGPRETRQESALARLVIIEDSAIWLVIYGPGISSPE